MVNLTGASENQTIKECIFYYQFVSCILAFFSSLVVVSNMVFCKGSYYVAGDMYSFAPW